MENILYLVFQGRGSYDDYYDWPVGAYTSKEAAQACIDAHNLNFRAIQNQQVAEVNECFALCEKLYPRPEYTWDFDEEPSAEYKQVQANQEAFVKGWEAAGKCAYVDEDLGLYILKGDDGVPLHTT